MSFEKYLRKKQIEKEAKEAAYKSVKDILSISYIRSELFEETLKQHKDSLSEELLKLGKHRQAQLVEWDIEQNESDYEFYFNAGWNVQQLKVDELQKRVDEQTRHIEIALLAVKDIYKSAIDEFHGWDVLNEKAPKLCEHLQNLSVAVGELEQALKGGVE